MNIMIPIGIAALLYITFIIWYGGRGKPMNEDEINERIENLAKIGEETKREKKENLKILDNFREVLAKDDGREFWMVNLMKFKDPDPNSEAMASHKRYSSGIAPLLLKQGSFPMFMSKVQGRFLHDGTEDWDQVAIIRYRSRRDFIKFATATAQRDLGDEKFDSMENTHVFPVKAVIRLGNIRLGFFLLLTVILVLIGL